ncbi:MAG: UDP-N-acetylmuramoyl-L-alanyl-D-glutamate--2,6-diaminopimelate ligase [bacterium]
MKLLELLKGIEISGTLQVPDMQIKGITLDSRNVKPGFLFIAVKGEKADGHEFISCAKSAGAAAVLTQKKLKENDIYAVHVPDTRDAMAKIARNFYKEPDKDINLVGITGTNGKTTVSYMVHKILQQIDEMTGMIGTIHHNICGNSIESKNTTPEAIDIYGMIDQIRKCNGEHLVMEVSSHALALKRVAGLKFNVAAFTNLSRDHMDFHKNEADYFECKSRLFKENLKENGTAVINKDDAHGRILLAKQSNALTFGWESRGKNDVYVRTCEYGRNFTKVTLGSPCGDLDIKTSLMGMHNIYNLMAGAACACALNVNPELIIKGLEELKCVPGRFESINAGQPYSIIVDYAHTPQALELLLKAAKEITRGRIICVFGCGGDRDMGKRSIMGKVVSSQADLVIVTSDNPRTEDPDSIINMVLEGVDKDKSPIVIADRQEAIYKAVNSACPEDCVIIAGKGHEDYQIIGSKRIHFDDREVVKNAVMGKTICA